MTKPSLDCVGVTGPALTEEALDARLKLGKRGAFLCVNPLQSLHNQFRASLSKTLVGAPTVREEDGNHLGAHF